MLVEVSGDAKVVLVHGEQRYLLPAEVPRGRYAIEATFPDQQAFEAGRITVMGGAPLTVVCLERLGLCSIM